MPTTRLQQILEDSVTADEHASYMAQVFVNEGVAEAYETEACSLLEEMGVRISTAGLEYDRTRALGEILGINALEVMKLAFFLDTLGLACAENILGDEKEDDITAVIEEEFELPADQNWREHGRSTKPSISLN